MLNITRKPGESIMIGKDVRITFKSFSGGQGKFSVFAPPEIEIWREEIFNKLHDENGNIPS